jgi:glycosyltransferase involved in cell wall biosynthesis
MARHLREAGHDVTVVTTSLTGALPDDRDNRVYRVTDLQSSPTLRKILRRAPTDGSTNRKGGAPTAENPAPRYLTHGLVPDATMAAWVPNAVRTVRRIVENRSVDCVITSAPPDSVATVPLFLGEQRPAWIADFRDGWRFEPLRGDWPTRVQDRIDARIERAVVERAEVVIGATEPIASDFGARFATPSAYVPNAWDPALDAEFATATPVALDDTRFNLVYTGQLSGPAGRDPRPLFEAMNLLVEKRGSAAKRLRLILVGGLDSHDEALLAELDVHGLVQTEGQQTRATSIATQRAADALLLLTTPGHASHATGKLFEYLAADRPILALAAGSAAAKIIADPNTGFSVAPDDPAAIAGALGELLDGRVSTHAPVTSELARYRYPGPAVHVEALIEDAIRARRSQAVDRH